MTVCETDLANAPFPLLKQQRKVNTGLVTALCIAVVSGHFSLPALAQSATPGQKRTPPASQPKQGFLAAQTVMAGAPLLVQWSGPTPAAEAAVVIALPDAAPATFVDGTFTVFRGGPLTLPVPGRSGMYELRLLTRDAAGVVTVAARQPLTAQPATATVNGPERVKRASSFAVRGTGPNGEHDVVTLVEAGADAGAKASHFLPGDNIEGRLDAADKPGRYELRYVMHAPLSGPTILARQPITVE